MKNQFTNELINSTSPYLLQHAHNPVNWIPWSEKAIEQAKTQDKLILISIGYSACHWCHVMEHESFENLEVARVMNENFVCIKVDREERPDVDNYYMTAIQLMQQQGGWPLNVIALPDGRPVWGGTYFPKELWMKNLGAINDYYNNHRIQTEDYAERLQQGIIQSSLVVPIDKEIDFDSEIIYLGVSNWKEKFDFENGGRLGAPKFPMPVNIDFLMYYAFIRKDKTTLEFIELTLKKMARGGIYDQIGGGFARYSVDEKWKVPHFEKMLYDNAQLLNTYSNGFQFFQKEEFKEVVYDTVEFLERELLDRSGAFYSSLDADSEGEEGKYYVWTEKELKTALKSDFDLFAKYFNINRKGYWEDGNYILLRDEAIDVFAQKNKLSQHQLELKIKTWKKELLKKRSGRIRPGLDDKTLTSWNALTVTGLVNAFKTFRKDKFLKLALNNAVFLRENLIKENGNLFHTWKNGVASVGGFLEDYALVIEAFLMLFENTGDKEWLHQADKLTQYVIQFFYDTESGLFYFSPKKNKTVVVNHFQKEDNVIPAANSVMGHNLHKLHLILGNPDYKKMVFKILQHIIPDFSKYPMAYANWGSLMLKITEQYYEIAVLGVKANEIIVELQQKGYKPNVLWAFSKKGSEIPILKDRLVNDKTLIYVCKDTKCDLPVRLVKQALEKME